jgi:hypothetical protein
MGLFSRQRLTTSQKKILKILRSGVAESYGGVNDNKLQRKIFAMLSGHAMLVTVFNQIQKAFPEKTPTEIMDMMDIDVNELYKQGRVRIAEAGWKWLDSNVSIEELEASALQNIKNVVEWNETAKVWQESKKLHSVTSLFLRRKFF